MAQGRCLGRVAPGAPWQAAEGGPDRLQPRGGRFVFHPCDARGEKTGPSPVDRRKRGSKHHLAVDANGTPLAATLTGANRHDVTQLLPLVEQIPSIKGKVGAPLTKPKVVMGDRGYDIDPHRLQ